MLVLSVLFNNFRNIKNLEINLSPGINLFYGMNGQGKTNILESVEILSTTRSDRAFRESELINHSQDFASVEGKFLKNTLDFDISINFFRNKKKSCIKNGKATTADNIFGAVNVVKFFPDDIEIIKGPPSVRRKYIDMEISLTDRLYYSNYKNYIKIIDARNALLKKVSDYPESSREYFDLLHMIKSYDELMPAVAYNIYAGRINFLNDIFAGASGTHRMISSNSEQPGVRYLSSMYENIQESMVLTENLFKERLTFLLKKNLKNDIIRKLTTVGPHRDDIEFLIDGKAAKNFGSTGQIKTLAVSLKLAQIDYIFDKINDYPVLLIDDLTSEFDAERLFNIAASISRNIQVIISSTNQKVFMDALRGPDIRYFEVHDGGIKS